MLIKNPVVEKEKKVVQKQNELNSQTCEKKTADSSKKSGQLFQLSLNIDDEPIKEKKKTTRSRAVVDDSIEVGKRIKELFSKYENRYKLVTTEAELIEYMSTRPELGFDTETTGLNRYLDKLVGFSIGNEVDCVYVPLNHKVGENYSGSLERLKEILTGNGRKYWGMNTKFDRGFMILGAGFDVPMCWDAELAARLIDNRDEAKLKAQYIKYIDPTEEFYEYKSLFKQAFDCYDPKVVGIYGGVDAIKHYVLGKFQKRKMEEQFPRIYKIMKNVELPLVDVILAMELRGVMIDKPYYEQFTAELQEQIDKKLGDIQSKYPSRSRKTGEEWLEKINHPIAQDILDIRKLKKSISTYTEAIPALAINDEDGNPIVHTTYHQIGADTGRFSSSNPNLQNQPKDNRFRRGFIARPGMMLVSADFSQQEQAILAGVSRDPKMLEGAEKGMDFYALMASIIWDLPYKECTKKGSHKELRNKCKSIVLGVTYGMGAQSLAESLNRDSKDHVYTVDEAEQIMARFYSGFPVVKQFQQWCHDFAKENGYMETVLGRRRYFKYLGRPAFEVPGRPDVEQTLNSLKYYNQIRALLDECKVEGIDVIDNRWKQGDELRQTVNHVMQGSAADQTKICMIALHNDPIFREKYKGNILLQIHDEIIAEFPEELADEGGKYMASVMQDIGSEVIMTKIWCEPDVMKFWQKS